MASSSGTCSRNLFNVSSSQSRCDQKKKELADENEVQQPKEGGGNLEKTLELNRSNQKAVDIETVAESLGVVAISLAAPGADKSQNIMVTPKRKWVRKKGEKRNGEIPKRGKEVEKSKRQLIDVMIVDESMEDCGSGEKKRKQDVLGGESQTPLPEVVLEA